MCQSGSCTQSQDTASGITFTKQYPLRIMSSAKKKHRKSTGLSESNAPDSGTEFLEQSQVMVYIKDAIVQLLKKKKDFPNPLQFLNQYFISMQTGEHITGRDFDYVGATIYNRQCFLNLVEDSFERLDDTVLGVHDVHQLLSLICRDFPFDIVVVAFNLVSEGESSEPPKAVAASINSFCSLCDALGNTPPACVGLKSSPLFTVLLALRMVLIHSDVISHCKRVFKTIDPMSRGSVPKDTFFSVMKQSLQSAEFTPEVLSLVTMSEELVQSGDSGIGLVEGEQESKSDDITFTKFWQSFCKAERRLELAARRGR